MSEWILSEQRWTNTRNWAKRTFKWVLFSLMLSTIVAMARTYWDFRYHWRPLQQIYFRQYLYSVVPKIFLGRSKYRLLVLMIPTRPKGFRESLATDQDVIPVDTEHPGKLVLITHAARLRGCCSGSLADLSRSQRPRDVLEVPEPN